MAACSSEDITQQTKTGEMQFTATIGAPNSGGTRTVYTISGVDINVAWKVGDKIALVHNGVKDVATVKTVNNNGSAIISGIITGNPSNGDDVALVYPAALVGTVTSGYNYTKDVTVLGKMQTQNGTLGYIQDNLDFREDMQTFSVNGTEVTLADPTGKLSSLNAIWKLTLQDSESTALQATKVTVKSGENVLASTATLGTAASTVYLTVPSVLEQSITIEATVGEDTYSFTKASVTLNSDSYYQSTVSMSDGKTIDLSTLTGDYEAKNGDTLTGTLSGNYKITISDDATVKLKDVDITNITNDYSHNWAGITCLGDAVVILEGTNVVLSGYEDCSGFIGASGKTLTIKGNGSLETRPTGSNRAGAGILIGENGHIVIQGGTIVTNGYDGCAGIQISGTGTVTITGGHITANGGPRAAGIGAGNTGTCGAINISGGTIIARGGEYAAAIGGGNWSVHGDITITSGVTSVSATKGSQSVHSIGNGYNPKSGCGTVTIGGVEGAISESPYTYQPSGGLLE